MGAPKNPMKLDQMESDDSKLASIKSDGNGNKKGLLRTTGQSSKKLMVSQQDLEKQVHKEARKLGLNLMTGDVALWGRCVAFMSQFCGAGRWQLPLAVICVLAYFLLAAVFYSYENDWSYSASLYYAAQTGWSVGYGLIKSLNLFHSKSQHYFILGVLIEQTDNSLWFTVFFVLAGASMIGGAVAILIALVLESEHATEIHCALVFILWIGAGVYRISVLRTPVYDVMYGMLEEKFNFIRALYFSVTSLSTGGLQVASINPDEDTFTNWFMAFWIMTGVPVFGIAVGQLAGVLVEAYTRHRLYEKLNAEVQEEDFLYACQIDKATGNEEVRFGEYLEFTLLRAGLVPVTVLDEIKNRFKLMDVDNSGSINILEMRASLEFDRYDVNGDGTITSAEFVAICHALGVGKSIEERVKIFSEVDADGSGSINREEYTEWFKSRDIARRGKSLVRDDLTLEEKALLSRGAIPGRESTEIEEETKLRKRRSIRHARTSTRAEGTIEMEPLTPRNHPVLGPQASGIERLQY
eukprot:jgi/Bigna1/78814/fgenesh1_pg.57_\